MTSAFADWHELAQGTLRPAGRTMTLSGIEFVELHPGYVRMGSHFKCASGNLLGRLANTVGLDLGTPPKHVGPPECPTAWVEIPSPFWISKTEITQDQLPHFNAGWSGDQPASIGITASVADNFATDLSEAHGMPIRLPTGREWEYACRAGSTTEYCFGDHSDRIHQYAVLHTQTEIERIPLSAGPLAGPHTPQSACWLC